MPLDLITGLPGNGKTAYLVSELLRFEKNGLKRKIYLCGIELEHDFNLDIEICSYDDVKDWTSFETGSLIVVDEAQNIFPQRSASAKAPDYITGLSTHRHYGFDFILITQDPRLLDAWVRRLIAAHRHIKRLFGSSFQVVFSWDKVSDNPRDRKEQSTSTKKITRLPKQVYGLYKSSVEHTVKRNVPKIIYILLACFVLFPVGAYIALTNFELGDNSETKQSPSVSEPASSLVTASSQDSSYVPDIAKNITNPERLIDYDLVFLDSIIYGKYRSITLAMIHPVTRYESRIELADLESEQGLKYSLISQNKLLLVHGETRKTLYRVVRPDVDQTILSDRSGSSEPRLKLPF